MYFSKTIQVKLYATKVQFIITSDIVKVTNNIYNKHNLSCDVTYSLAGCCIQFDMNHYYIVINSEYITYNTILHELHHCIYAIASDRSVFEDEAKAWIQGEVGQEIFNFINYKGIKVG